MRCSPVWPLTATVLLFALPACQKTQVPRDQPVTSARGKTPAALSVTSPAFEPGKPIPKMHAYQGEGDNLSPPLRWSAGPAGTRSFAIICEDPDAPSPSNPREKPWVHWVVYNIPADRTSLEQSETKAGITGKTDFGETAWGGPMPPAGSGVHRYFFRVFALESRLELAPGATRDELLQAMQGLVLARGEVYGTYERKRP